MENQMVKKFNYEEANLIMVGRTGLGDGKREMTVYLDLDILLEKGAIKNYVAIQYDKGFKWFDVATLNCISHDGNQILSRLMTQRLIALAKKINDKNEELLKRFAPITINTTEKIMAKSVATDIINKVEKTTTKKATKKTTNKNDKEKTA